MLHLASGQLYFGTIFPPFLIKQLYRCDSVFTVSFVGTSFITRSWGWLLDRWGYSITHHHTAHAQLTYILCPDSPSIVGETSCGIEVGSIESYKVIIFLFNFLLHHHHHHKHQGFNPLILSVSRVTAARANASSVFQLFSFLVVYRGMISKGFGLWHSLQVWKPVPSVFI